MNEFRHYLKKALRRRASIDEVVNTIMNDTQKIALLYSLTKDTDKTVAWHALWACEKLCKKSPSLFFGKQEDWMNEAMQCKHKGMQRLWMSMLLSLPTHHPVNVPFFNFCLHTMSLPSESPAVRTLCIKLAHAICRSEKELMPEFSIYLNNMQPEYCTAAVISIRKNTLRAMYSHPK